MITGKHLTGSSCPRASTRATASVCRHESDRCNWCNALHNAFATPRTTDWDNGWATGAWLSRRPGLSCFVGGRRCLCWPQQAHLPRRFLPQEDSLQGPNRQGVLSRHFSWWPNGLTIALVWAPLRRCVDFALVLFVAAPRAPGRPLARRLYFARVWGT